MFRVPCISLLFGLAVVSCFAQSTTTGSEPSPTAANPLGDARALYRKGDFDKAIAKYQEYQKDHPNSPDSYTGIMRVYLKQKKLDEAVQAVQLGMQYADSPRMRVAQAELWFRQGKIVEAESAWVKVINSGTPDARAYLGLSHVDNAVAMYKSAQKYIQKAHDIDPDDPDVNEAWVGTLSRAQRIKYLEDSLAGDNNWDEEKRAGIKSYLEYLKERSLQKRNPCRLASKVTSTETPLLPLLIDPRHMRGLGLTVSLNGHKSNLLLDTGAGGILVTRSVAQHAGVSKMVEVQIGGIGDKGRKKAFVGIVDSIKIGQLEFQNCPIEVIERGSLADEDGLIGPNVFEEFLVDLDFPNAKLKLSELPKRPGDAQQNLGLKNEDEEDEADSSQEREADKSADPGNKDTNSASAAATPVPAAKPAPKPAEATPPRGPQDRYIAPEMKDYSRFFRFGHFLLIPTKIGDVPYKLFAMDSGAFNNIISPAAAREVTKVAGDSNLIVKGLSGQVNKVYTADKTVLTFGHLRQENQEMTSFETKNISDHVGTEISGFLGFPLLRMLDIKIDYRDALVDFEYDKKRFGGR